jgi:hypothetical protein
MRKYLYFIASLMLFTSLILAQPTPSDDAVSVDHTTFTTFEWTTADATPTTNDDQVKIFVWSGNADPNNGSAVSLFAPQTLTQVNPFGGATTESFDISTVPASLSDNIVYYWAIWDNDFADPTTDANASNAISGPYRFSTGDPLAFTMAGATPSNVGDVDATPTFDWPDATGGFPPYSYTIEIADENTFTPVDFDKTVLVSTENSLVLDNNTVYYWRVSVTDDASTSINNVIASDPFKTEIGAFDLATPSDGSSHDNWIPEPPLTWSAVTGNTIGIVYDVYVDGSTVATNLGATNFDPSLASGNHSWYVVAKDQSGSTPSNSNRQSTSTWDFTLNPVLINPLNTLTGVSVLPKFEWIDEAQTSYTIEIGTTSGVYPISITVDNGSDADDFNDFVDAGATITYQANEYHADFPLANNTWYFWRVTYDGGTEVSEEFSFKTTNDLTISAGNPLDNAFVYLYDPLLFSWYINQAQGTLKFALQIYEKTSAPTELEWAEAVDNYLTATPNSFFFAHFDNITDLTRTVNGLSGGTRYFWRIVAYYDDGSSAGSFDYDDRVAKFSNAFYFDTKGGAVEAFPSWPTGGATVYTLQPYFYWYTLEYEPSATFEVIVSTSNAVDGVTGELNAGTISTYSAGSNLFVQATADLDPGTVYYWQVKTTYGTDETFSVVATFETDAIAGVVAFVPTPSYPVDGATVYTTSPYLYWYVGGVSTDLLFEVEVSTDFNFNNIVIDQNGISGLFYQGSGLTAGVSYFWRVRSYENGNPGNISTWSATGEFTVAGGGSSHTVASYPVSNPTVYSATPTLSWYVEGSTLGWTGYVVRWVEANTAPANWADPGQYDGTTTINDINQTTYTFGSALNYGSTYYWAVALTDGGAPVHGDFAVGSFTVVGGSTSTVIPTTPANNTTVYSNDVTFYWYLSGSYLGLVDYSLRYSQQANMGNPITINGITNNFHEVTGLTPGATYYWQVQGNYGATQTAWSTTYSFAIVAGSAPVVPRIGSPANGVTIDTGSPILSWFNPVASSSELTYDVELADNENFADAAVYSDLAQLKAEASNLESGQYFWRVRSKTNSEISGYSATGNFKVKDGITSVEEEEVLPTVFGLEQNYPNPFNPTTTIKFSLPESHFVSIKIYNMLGQEVRTLVNDQRNQGTYNVVWNGKDNYGNQVASGTYIYRISAGDFVSTKKMVLLK